MHSTTVILYQIALIFKYQKGKIIFEIEKLTKKYVYIIICIKIFEAYPGSPWTNKIQNHQANIWENHPKWPFNGAKISRKIEENLKIYLMKKVDRTYIERTVMPQARRQYLQDQKRKCAPKFRLSS